jgi:hypothetical protein
VPRVKDKPNGIFRARSEIHLLLSFLAIQCCAGGAVAT